ncbi:GNAT family N-acetyltransferase [Caulobacter segnis]|uniref:GNAT family N-acetyltransferase n=1 Tax=Caulobacter segnis TaxID=88688 RepID=UPI00240F2A31|nr:GNAT family N-acetyltransferase [Caulobacter segnis]MDG2520989.1 GNAT family N-acetyltransferase [Caulobacter segnis]
MQIVEFEPRHAEAWRVLNEAWLTKFFVIEAKDRLVLDNPGPAILDKGGRIFMAEADGETVGCVALIPMEDGGYEVGKMAVDERMQGKGYARKLMEACIHKARELGAPRLYLESSSHLTPALTLYESVGFVHLPPSSSPYVRADVWMEMKL